MQHSFDIDIAKEYGIIEAILLNNIQHWIEKNKANEINFYDGCYWTYNSTKAFKNLFPYVSQRQIQNALKKLIDNGILQTGNYNKLAFDRTLWYSFTPKGECIMQKCKMQDANLLNGLDKNAQPIPYINTYIKEIDNNKLLSKESPKKALNVELFNKFYNAYPKKRNKGDVEKAFIKLNPSEELVDLMIKKINVLKETKQWKDNNGQYIPYPSSFLNKRIWEDEIELKEDPYAEYIRM